MFVALPFIADDRFGELCAAEIMLNVIAVSSLDAAWFLRIDLPLAILLT